MKAFHPNVLSDRFGKIITRHRQIEPNIRTPKMGMGPAKIDGSELAGLKGKADLPAALLKAISEKATLTTTNVKIKINATMLLQLSRNWILLQRPFIK